MASQVSDLISHDVKTVDKASDWPIPNLGKVKTYILARRTASRSLRFYKPRGKDDMP